MPKAPVRQKSGSGHQTGAAFGIGKGPDRPFPIFYSIFSAAARIRSADFSSPKNELSSVRL